MSEIIEIILIGIIILVQLYVFRDTWKKIELFKIMIPFADKFYTVKVRIADNELETITAKQIFENLYDYTVHEDDENGSSHKKQVELVLINTYTEQSATLNIILTAINTYLLRNKGAVSDFNLIKDVVERNTDALDEQINTQLPIPLYLGLMGTMLGIIVGLWNMAGVDESGVSTLIQGVSIAMLASFVGLTATTLNSGLFYKGAKAEVEKLKNDFYTMIQTEMLPVMSKDTTSAIIALQQNLNRFNSEFTNNMGGFESVLTKILTSLDGQVDMMTQLKDIDVATIAKLNVSVMRELRESAKEFEKFNSYLSQVNDFVDNAKQLNFNIGTQLERTQSIENIAQSINSNTDLNKQLIKELQSELHEIDARKQYMTDAVISVDDTIKKSLDDLQSITQTRIQAVKDIVLKEEDFVDKLISKDATNFDELKNLSKMRESIEAMCVEDKTQTEHVKALMASQDAKIDRVVGEMSVLIQSIDKRDSQKNASMTSVRIALYVCAACVVVFMAYLLYQGQTTQYPSAEDRLIEYLENQSTSVKIIQ